MSLYLVAAASFYFIYKFLEYFPWLLRTPFNLGTRALVQKIAHRGSRGEGLPENTKAAFVDACEGGAQVLEVILCMFTSCYVIYTQSHQSNHPHFSVCLCLQLDVWILRDGQVVVFHDSDFTRMTAGGSCSSQDIADLSYSELPELRPNDPDWDQSSRCPLYSIEDCRRVPLLEDVFKVVPKETCFIIEFKQDSQQLISEVHRLVKAAGRYDTVMWFSLKEKVNKKLRAFDPLLPTLTSVDNMLKIVMSYYCGFMPFMPIPDKVFGITLDAV